MPSNNLSQPFVPSWRLTRAAITSGLARRRYRVIRIEVPTTTTKNSQPLAHAQVPAGRNRHRRKMSNVHPTPRIRRRRSVGSGLLLVMSSRSSQDRSLPMPMDRTRRSLRLSPDSPGLVQFNRNVANRQRIASLRVVRAPSSRGTCLLLFLSDLSKVTSAGNRQRPPYGGNHERRIQRSSTRYHSPPRRPHCQADLPDARPLRVLVPQVVAPLPGVRRRGPLRPDPCQPLRHPAHPARVGAHHPLYPTPASGPHLAGHPLQPDRGQLHPRRVEGFGRPSTSLRTHRRACPAAQRFQSAAGPPGAAAATPRVSRPAGQGLQPTP